MMVGLFAAIQPFLVGLVSSLIFTVVQYIVRKGLTPPLTARRKKALEIRAIKQQLEANHPELWQVVTVLESDSQSANSLSTGINVVLGFVVNTVVFVLGVIATKNQWFGL